MRVRQELGVASTAQSAWRMPSSTLEGEKGGEPGLLDRASFFML